MLVIAVRAAAVIIPCVLSFSPFQHKMHAALGAVARSIAAHLRMHGAHVHRRRHGLMRFDVRHVSFEVSSGLGLELLQAAQATKAIGDLVVHDAVPRVARNRHATNRIVQRTDICLSVA